MDNQQLQKLRDLPIEGVAEHLGLHIRQHKSLCPFHDDHHASLSFNIRRNTFRCFACGASGNTIDLVMKTRNMGFRDACGWMGMTDYNLPNLQNNSQRSRQTDTKTGFDAARYERFFERPFLNDAARRFLFEERKLDERVVRWCRLTSWTDRSGVSWLQIPYYDENGRLTGVQNRNLSVGAQPRFRFPSGSVCGIYNLPVLSRLRSGDELYITEGCSDCWAMLSAGHKAIAIPSATLLNYRDAQLLSALATNNDQNLPTTPNLPNPQNPPTPRQASPHRGGDVRRTERVSFRMYPDHDVPGETLFLNLKKIIPDLEHLQLPPGCKDFSDYYLRIRA